MQPRGFRSLVYLWNRRHHSYNENIKKKNLLVILFTRALLLLRVSLQLFPSLSINSSTLSLVPHWHRSHIFLSRDVPPGCPPRLSWMPCKAASQLLMVGLRMTASIGPSLPSFRCLLSSSNHRRQFSGALAHRLTVQTRHVQTSGSNLDELICCSRAL